MDVAKNLTTSQHDHKPEALPNCAREKRKRINSAHTTNQLKSNQLKLSRTAAHTEGFSHHQRVSPKSEREKKLSDTRGKKAFLIRSIPVLFECFGIRGFFTI